ncbi:hypothetical protein D7V91_00445 [bacterium 1xD42-67]|nr:hypothetical protein D7V91_00445 [bacterium 1xD42-67]
MRSATSYFNGALYRKTMARFWPLWGLWGLVWIFLIPLRLLSTYFNDFRWRSVGPQTALLLDALDLPALTEFGMGAAILFAVLCAMAVFGYLYSHRSACWTHALPLRREALFTTQYLAGLSFLLLPLLAVALLAAIVEVSFLPAQEWGKALSALLLWLLAQTGVCLFFFSFAAFCAMFTGHILALPAFYFILNVLVAVVWSLLDTLMTQFYYGYISIGGILDVVAWLTPSEALAGALRWDLGETGYRFQSPETVAIYAAVGVILALAALFVYRRRHVETAGDVVAVPLVRPLFKYGVSFCAGLAFGIYTAAFFNFLSLPALILCILVWSVIGYFAAEMLLKKSFRVLRAWKGAAAMTTVLLVLSLACLADVFGFVSRIPDPGQVESVRVNFGMGYPYDSGRSLDCVITAPDQIERIVALHRAIVDDRERTGREGDGFQSGDDYARLNLDYVLKNGGTFSRYYVSVPIYTGDQEIPGTVAYAMEQLTGDRELTALAYGFEGFIEDARLTSVYLDGLYHGGEIFGSYLYLDDYRQELWDAVQQDFDEGTIGVRYLFDRSEERQANTYRADLVFESFRNYSGTYSGPADAPDSYSETRSYYGSLTITLTPQAKHTLAVLDEAGVWEKGYSLVPQDESEAQYPKTQTVR